MRGFDLAVNHGHLDQGEPGSLMNRRRVPCESPSRTSASNPRPASKPERSLGVCKVRNENVATHPGQSEASAGRGISLKSVHESKGVRDGLVAVRRAQTEANIGGEGR